MKYSVKVLIIIILTFVSCKEETRVEEFEAELTVDRAKEIIKEYGLDEGTITFSSDSLGTGETNITEKEFIDMIVQIAEYQNSEQGIIAKKMNDFYSKSENLTKQKIDSFNLELDKEFNNKYTNVLAKSSNNKIKEIQTDSIVSSTFSSHDKYK